MMTVEHQCVESHSRIENIYKFTKKIAVMLINWKYLTLKYII